MKGSTVDSDMFMNQRVAGQQQTSKGDDESFAASELEGDSREGDGNAVDKQEKQSDLMTNKSEQHPIQLQQHQHGQRFVSFHSSEYKKHRERIYIRFALIILSMATLLLTALSIYWGAFYEISDKVKDLKMLVVIGDENTIEGVPPVFGD
ncbi:hypothetical protein CANMA_000522, partial [Candida margitis]|uniref:uncharacterized protein n=1 Tax=Candida margitis TaxID=1775924 RepID=UPI0022264FEC